MGYKTIIVGFFLATSFSVSAKGNRGDKVPSVVVNAFNVKYPSAKKVQWVKEGAEFEVEFELQETDFSATFDSSGKWIETESSIAFDKMPAAVRNTLQYSFAGYKIKETEKVDSEKWGSGFEVLLKKKHDRRILVLNEKGEVINNEPEI